MHLAVVIGRQRTQENFRIARAIKPDVILLAHGAALVSPEDARYMIEHTGADGVQLGSSIERPTAVRWLVCGLACFTSWLLYLHRYAWGVIKPAFRSENPGFDDVAVREQRLLERRTLGGRARLNDHALRTWRRRRRCLAEDAIEFRVPAGRTARRLCRQWQHESGGNRQCESGSGKTVFHREQRQSNREATTDGLVVKAANYRNRLGFATYNERGTRIVRPSVCAET